MTLVHDFPLLPVGIVALPTELIPLQINEERFRQMIDRCLQERSEFGIIWMADDGVRPIGCACEVAEILESASDKRLQLIVRGTRPFRITEREEKLPYPAGTVEFLDDRDEQIDPQAAVAAHDAYSALVEQLTLNKPDSDYLNRATAYEMAATLELGLDSKQGLLDLRSESARLRLLTRLFRAASKRLDSMERVHEQARTNGKVHFPLG